MIVDLHFTELAQKHHKPVSAMYSTSVDDSATVRRSLQLQLMHLLFIINKYPFVLRRVCSSPGQILFE
ncbi:hypothetical protein Plhal304r1_c002g0004931 [Plasmopara halstedii]